MTAYASNPLADFPTVEQLLWGTRLALVVHAVTLTRHPAFEHEISWDRNSFSFQNSMGSRGTITFSAVGVVAAFFTKDSPRAWKWNDGLLAGMPEDLRAVADNETLQYLMDYNVEGETRPAFTAVMWGTDRLTAIESWPTVFEHGAYLIKVQLMEQDAAMTEYQDDTGVSDEIVRVARSLFERKRDAGWSTAIDLSPEDLRCLRRSSKSVSALDVSLRVLAGLGIRSHSHEGESS